MLLFAKLLTQFAYPLLTSLLLAGAGGLLLCTRYRGTGGVLVGFALGWLWLWSTPVFSDWLRATLEQRYPPVLVEALPTADAIVVLGGTMQGARPPMRLYSNLEATADRVWYAARLFRAGKAPRILLTGGNLPWGGIEQPEADGMAELLEDLGIPKTALLLEGRSRTTEQNRDYSLPILHRLGVKRILLVTSALHMPRALRLFEATDLAVVPAPADFEVFDRDNAHPLRWLPDAQALADSSRAYKEYLGTWLLQLSGR